MKGGLWEVLSYHENFGYFYLLLAHMGTPKDAGNWIEGQKIIILSFDVLWDLKDVR